MYLCLRTLQLELINLIYFLANTIILYMFMFLCQSSANCSYLSVQELKPQVKFPRMDPIYFFNFTGLYSKSLTFYQSFLFLKILFKIPSLKYRYNFCFEYTWKCEFKVKQTNTPRICLYFRCANKQKRKCNICTIEFKTYILNNYPSLDERNEIKKEHQKLKEKNKREKQICPVWICT